MLEQTSLVTIDEIYRERLKLLIDQYGSGSQDELIVMPFRKGAEKGHSFAFLKDEVLPDAAQSLMNCVYVLIKKDS